MGGDRIGLQMRLLECLPDVSGDFRWIGMMRLLEDRCQLVQGAALAASGVG
jgi:hypothetical protein